MAGRQHYFAGLKSGRITVRRERARPSSGDAPAATAREGELEELVEQLRQALAGRLGEHRIACLQIEFALPRQLALIVAALYSARPERLSAERIDLILPYRAQDPRSPHAVPVYLCKLRGLVRPKVGRGDPVPLLRGAGYTVSDAFATKIAAVFARAAREIAGRP